MNHTDIIKTNYYNPTIGFKSASSMYDKLKQYGITKKEITDFIKKQSVQQQFAQTPHIKHYHPIKSNYKNQILQADLVDISDISRYNEGIKYLLIVIDVFSRFASAEPLKDKNASTVTNAMNEILKEITPKPEILITDNGSEFISKPFETLIKDNNISHDFANVGDHKKLGIVDRFVRTLRELINRYMIANKTNKYINVFQDLIFNYNNSYHRGIKGKPAKVAINSPKLIKIMKEKDKLANEEEQQFFVGDNVRYIKNKVMFEKGTAPKWSEILHKIIKANKHSYILDNNKSYKYYELQKNDIVENAPIIEEIQPTRPTIRKENKRLRVHAREGIDESTIIKERRIPKLKEQFKSLLSR